MTDSPGNLRLTEAPQGSSRNRLAYIDNLKALMTIMVVLVHAAVTYSGIGSWFYVESKNLKSGSFYPFLFFLTFNQAYFMSLFFMIAAYFIPPSLEKKGTRKFIADRFFRLGIPTLIFIFVISPFTRKLIHPALDLTGLYLKGIATLQFMSWTGPMWFALTLLIFSLVFSLTSSWFARCTSQFSFTVTTRNILMLVGVITVTAFGIRLVYPIGTSFMNLQFCFFAAYIYMLLLGIIACQKNLFETIDYIQAKRWCAAAFALGVPFWILVVCNGVNRDDFACSAILGGWNLPAFGYALWESFFCVTVIVGLLGIFKRHFNRQNPFQKFLSDNSFGVYALHPPILVGISLLFRTMPYTADVKFFIVSCSTLPACFIAVSLIRKISPVRRLFS